jgi:geranylgeranyl diphosphate synthase type II
MLNEDEALSIVNQHIVNCDYSIDPKGLYEPIGYVLSIGGKRLRPVFTLLACNLFKDDISESIAPAIGVEIFHNFTLLHDDIMDKALMRRNSPTVHVKWNDSTAILSGDAMQIDAYRWIARTPDRWLKKVLDLFSDTAMQVCEGQQYDMDFENRSTVDLDDYLEMIRLKTAVLLACSLQIGAWIGGADDKEASLLYDFGINFGMAFQLQDDLLDVYGNPDKFGKNIGGDILCNKKTFLLISALNTAPTDVRNSLEKWLKQKEYRPEDKIKAITDIYNELNIRKLCENQIAFFCQRALNSLELLKIGEQKAEVLRTFVLKLMLRES